jgi:glutamate racemase
MKMPKNNHAIGLFDSGVGGLTVLKEVIRALPKENIVYFADTARIPYGEKSRETIIRFSIENTIFLLEQNIKMLVVPCNTATAHAIDKLHQIFNIPIIGVVEPGAKKAVSVTKNGRIAVLGTRGTIKSGIYQREIKKRLPEAEVIAISCPLFVPLVEERMLSHPVTKLVIQEYLTPLKKASVDTLLLGCTHYPLLRKAIQEFMGEDVTIVDSASTCAEEVLLTLSHEKLHCDGQNDPKHHYYVSDDPQKFQQLGSEFLESPLTSVSLKVD